MELSNQVLQTLRHIETDWWSYRPAASFISKPVQEVVSLANRVKQESITLAPELSELRIHHLVACLLQGEGVPAYVVVGRDRASDIISPAYRSWVTVEGVGPVSTSSDVEQLCDEIVRLPDSLAS